MKAAVAFGVFVVTLLGLEDMLSREERRPLTSVIAVAIV